MLKKIFSLLLTLTLCLCLSACGGTEAGSGTDTKLTPTPAAGSAAEAQNTPEPAGTDGAPAALREPILEWWELYNPNGFDTLTAALRNPNDIPVDVTYDVVYYKDGAEVARSEAFANFSLLPGGSSLVWANYDIPKSTDADEIRLENVIVTEAYDAPIDGSYEFVGVTDGNAYFDFTFDRKPTLATINFLLYNDKNQNGQFDKGEIVVVGSDSLMEQTGRVSFETDVFAYTDYEVYFTAY